LTACLPRISELFAASNAERSSSELSESSSSSSEFWITRSAELLLDMEENAGGGTFSSCGEIGLGDGLSDGPGDDSGGSLVGGGERLEVYPACSGGLDTEDFAWPIANGGIVGFVTTEALAAKGALGTLEFEEGCELDSGRFAGLKKSRIDLFPGMIHFKQASLGLKELFCC